MKKAKGLRKYFGLMFRTRKTEPLVFNLEKYVLTPIHSFFVFFPFAAIFYDHKGKIVDFKLIKPFTIFKPKKPYMKLVEIPR